MPQKYEFTTSELKLIQDGKIEDWNKLITQRRQELGEDTIFVIENLELINKNFSEESAIDFNNTRFVHCSINDCALNVKLTGEFVAGNTKNGKDTKNVFTGNTILCDSKICLKVADNTNIANNNFLGAVPEIWCNSPNLQKKINKDIEETTISLKGVSCEDGLSKTEIKTIKDYRHPPINWTPKSVDSSVSVGGTINKPSLYTDVTHFAYPSSNIANRFSIGSTFSSNQYGPVQKITMTPFSIGTYLGVNRNGQDSYMTNITIAPTYNMQTTDYTIPQIKGKNFDELERGLGLDIAAMSHAGKFGLMAGVNIPITGFSGNNLEVGTWRAVISYPIPLPTKFNKDKKKGNDHGSIELGLYVSGTFGGNSIVSYNEQVFEGANLVTYSGVQEVSLPKTPNIGVGLTIPLNFMKDGPTPPKGRHF